MKTINIPLNGELYDFIVKYGNKNNSDIVTISYPSGHTLIANSKTGKTYITIKNNNRHSDCNIVCPNLSQYIYQNATHTDDFFVSVLLKAYYKHEQIALTLFNNRIFIEGYYNG